MNESLILLAGFAFFVVIWIFTAWLVALMGGWRELATVYRGEASMFQGRTWSFQSARFRGTMRYNNALIIGVNEQALMLRMILFFRFSHPTLIIPWSDVSVSTEQGFFQRYVVLTFARVPNVPVKLFERRARQMLPPRLLPAAS